MVFVSWGWISQKPVKVSFPHSWITPDNQNVFKLRNKMAKINKPESWGWLLFNYFADVKGLFFI